MEKSIITPCNQWLTKNWETYLPSKLPDSNRVCDYIRKLTLREFCDNSAVVHEVSEFAETWNMHIERADTVTITLVDVRLLSAEEDSGRTEDEIQIGTWAGGEFQNVFSVYITKDEQASKPHHVHTGEKQHNMPLMEAVKAVMSIQERQGGTSIDRWMTAPADFRRAHPICPKCGFSYIRCMDFGWPRKRVLGCDSCDWTAHKALQYPEELDQEAFKEEYNRVRKAQQAESDLIECIQRTKHDAEQLAKLMKEFRKYNQPSKQVDGQLQEIISSIENSRIPTARGKMG